jgi:hypothetical protein
MPEHTFTDATLDALCGLESEYPHPFAQVFHEMLIVD